jgi:hypothetical protein
MSFVDIAILHFLLFALSRTEAFLATLTMKEWGFSSISGRISTRIRNVVEQDRKRRQRKSALPDQ